MGMIGIDGEIALLQMVRADLSVKWKNTIANDELEAAQGFSARQAFQYALAA